jgi:hypothetical protein
MPSLAHVALIAALSLGIPGVAWGKHRHGPGCGHRAFHYRQEAEHYRFHQYPYTRWEHQRFHKEQKWKHKYYHKGYYYPSYRYPLYPRNRVGVFFYWGR